MIIKYFFIIFGVRGTALHRADRLHCSRHDSNTRPINEATTNFYGKSFSRDTRQSTFLAFLLYVGKVRNIGVFSDWSTLHITLGRSMAGCQSGRSDERKLQM